ncbi:MAG TPA: endonuclease/exonuclease/phosphatase family protein [Chthoniobacterales bacterium]|jgi:endonuclease/exonuclease/phosphatase (EEP) superfamily protein YafD|nr:endonuclease/exonuclease/phosphatase family protein [Chthoniobacterales bacterium]
MFPRTLLAVLCAASVFSAQPAFAETPAPQITATFWNIQWFPGRRPNASRGDEARQIRSVHSDLAQLRSDIVAFEEVRDWENAVVAARPLAGFKVDVISNFPPREGQNEAQQVVITSRLETIAAWSELWKPSGVLLPPRGFAFAAYQLAPGKLLLVYVLHLKSNRGEIREDIRIREESMQQLVAHMKAMQNAYGKLGNLAWIVGGDFNTTPDEPRFASEKTVKLLTDDGFKWCWAGIPFTSRITVPADARYPAASFDQIFYRGLTLEKAWVGNTSPQSSDHRAVNATFTVAGER